LAVSMRSVCESILEGLAEQSLTSRVKLKGLKRKDAH
jgi:hypothetical protein